MLFGALDDEKNKTIAELEEENQRKEVELSIAQKNALLARLKAENLSLKKDFGGNIKQAFAWFKSH